MSTLKITLKLTGEVQLNTGKSQVFDRNINLSLDDFQGDLSGDQAREIIAAVKGYLAATLQDAIDQA